MGKSRTLTDSSAIDYSSRQKAPTEKNPPGKYKTNGVDFFISHVGEDKFVIALRNSLENNGFTAFLDLVDTSLGNTVAIRDALTASKRALFVYTEKFRDRVREPKETGEYSLVRGEVTTYADTRLSIDATSALVISINYDRLHVKRNLPEFYNCPILVVFIEDDTEESIINDLAESTIKKISNLIG